MTKQDAKGPFHSYEQIRKADGTVEYHEAGGALGHALREQRPEAWIVDA